jgi:hypothetical protein
VEPGFTTRKLLTVVVVWAGLLWQGYRARRKVWTQRSWLRFGLLFASGWGLVALSVMMAYGVDAGVYHHVSFMIGRLYFFTMVVLVLAGVLGTSALLIWFANGRPDRQLG